MQRHGPIPFIDLRPANELLRSEIDSAIARVISGGNYLRGSETDAFEKEWAAYCGQKYCVTCASGTDALTLAALALDIRTASIQANTLPLTGTGLARGGADVVVVDVGTDGYPLATPADYVAVLLYGRKPTRFELDAHLFDAAHAHGWQPPAGATACWSFYPTKNLGALGDAGAITTNDENIAAKLRMFSGPDDQLRDPSQINSRMDEIQAAILRVKLRHLDGWLANRRELAHLYSAELPSSVQIIPDQLDGFNHLVVTLCEDRNGLQKHLSQNGIQTKVHYPVPLHKINGPWLSKTTNLPGAEKWCSHVLSLPCYPGLAEESVQHISRVISDGF